MWAVGVCAENVTVPYLVRKVDVPYYGENQTWSVKFQWSFMNKGDVLNFTAYYSSSPAPAGPANELSLICF